MQYPNQSTGNIQPVITDDYRYCNEKTLPGILDIGLSQQDSVSCIQGPSTLNCGCFDKLFFVSE